MSKFKLVQKFFQRYWGLLILLFFCIYNLITLNIDPFINSFALFSSSTIICLLWCDFDKLKGKNNKKEKEE